MLVVPFKITVILIFFIKGLLLERNIGINPTSAGFSSYTPLVSYRLFSRNRPSAIKHQVDLPSSLKAVQLLFYKIKCIILGYVVIKV